MHQPDAIVDGRNSILMYQMEDGQRRDLADLCCKILSRTERAKGVEKVPSVKPRKQSIVSDVSMAWRKYFVLEDGRCQMGSNQDESSRISKGKATWNEKQVQLPIRKSIG